MKKQRVMILNEQQDNNDVETFHILKQGLDQVETFPFNTPDLQWFEKMVLEEQHHQKKKLIKDLSIFSLIALFILGGIMLSLSQMPIIFFVLQIITTVFIALYSGIRYSIGRVKNER